jgi:transposase-like protein
MPGSSCGSRWTTGCWTLCWIGEPVRAVLERVLEAELAAHLGHERPDRGGAENARNGAIAKEL